MSRFRIYSGLRGDYGGAKYVETREFDSTNVAEKYAHDMALYMYYHKSTNLIPDKLEHRYNNFSSPEDLLDYYVMQYPE